MVKLQYRTMSKRTVDALSVEDKDAVFWDDKIRGFGVRVYPSGSKVFVVQTRTQGKSKRITLGRYGVMTADQARKKTAENHCPAEERAGAGREARPGGDGGGIGHALFRGACRHSAASRPRGRCTAAS